MIGVVIPAHNEATYIEQCLASVNLAAGHPRLAGIRVEVLVVLDDCTDDTGALAHAAGVTTLAVTFRNVGRSRALGAQVMIEEGAQWLAFTDADTQVPFDWLARQLDFEADAVCGTVQVDSWEHHAPEVRDSYLAAYRFVEGHRHIHGANLGLSAKAYLSAGGFQHLAAHEDVQLVADLERTGARIVWTATHPVVTSARRDFKCREGFGDYLLSLEAPVSAAL
ncbi:glycosyltransferase [Pseudomonas sp.]|uniref:glycosyltransferase n=1 Tax=Pseudomonas sp. TaxID=306 RepID=UPI00258DE0C1|nr:glycosyltransferase [Pseudomonas sp.]